MTLRNPEIGSGNGYNRAFGPSDQSKIKQARIQESFAVDVSLREELVTALSNGQPTLTRMTRESKEYGPLGLREGEPAYKRRGRNTGVLTALNGLDAQFMERYPGDPEMVRQCVRSVVQFVGIVTQDARNDLYEPRVTLQIGGTATMFAPGQFNVPGYDNTHPQVGDKVYFDVPNLKEPVVAGSAKDVGKIVLVPRAATKESMAAGILREAAHITHDPQNYKAAMEDFGPIANAKMQVAVALKNAALMNGLMLIDLLINAGVLTVAAAELNGVTTADKVAQLAEGLSLLHPGDHNIAQPGAFAAGLTPAQTRAWQKIEFDAGQRLLPLPSPDTGKYNARTEFAMRYDAATNSVTSSGRSTSTGELLRTPVGELLGKSLTTMPHMVQALAYAIDEENRNCAGTAASTPNQFGTGQFTLLINPQGGLVTKI